MAYVIIGIVLLLIIAPILAILPNARQKAQMAKRQQAMKQGVRVELTHLEDPDPDPGKYLSNTGRPLERKLAVAAYRIQRPRSVNWRQYPSSDWQLDQSKLEGWVWNIKPHRDIPNDLTEFVSEHLELMANDLANDLSIDLVRVEEKKFTVSVYWHERGEVKPVIDFLKGCIALNIIPPETDEVRNIDRLE